MKEEKDILKDIWKDNANREIKQYSPEELDTIIIKRSRNSITNIYTIIASVIILLSILIFFVVLSVKRSFDILYVINNFILIVCTLTSLACSIYSQWKMLKYDRGECVRKWLRFRIDAFTHSLKRKKIYLLILPLIFFLTHISLTSYIKNIELYTYLSNARYLVPAVMQSLTVGIIMYYFLYKKNKITYTKKIKELNDILEEIE